MRSTLLLITVPLLLTLNATALADSNLDWLPDVVDVPAGDFIAGSRKQERETAYSLDEQAYGHSVTREQRWYDYEYKHHVRYLAAFSIMKTPVTRCDYARFIDESDHATPVIDKPAWDAQRLKHHYPSTLKFQWKKGEQDHLGRCDHPVVLVTHSDARAYAEWLSNKSGQTWRLPTEFEWEKAARGLSGALFPWGNQYDPQNLNSHDNGPFDTIAVGSFSQGASPFGMLDAAGQVFEWTSVKHPERQRYVVKGGSWDDKGCGVCRPAARHYRDENIKHILVGFRLVKE